MKKSLTIRVVFVSLMAVLLFTTSVCTFGATRVKQQFYEIRIYRVNQSSQSERIDSYLKYAFIPALHRAGIDKIGVFKPIERDTAFGKLIYVFIPFKNVDQYLKLSSRLQKDKDYQKAGKEFLEAPYNDPAFERYESILLKAFTGMPQFKVPEFDNPVGERIYELRNYRSATEAKAAKKIEMFNKGGEIEIFKSIGSQPVFFGEVLMGSQKPNLMYLTTYRDMATHDEKWKSFGNSPAWKELSGKEEYKNTVSKLTSSLLHPTSYSDF